MLTIINPQCSDTTLHYTTLQYVARHDAMHKNAQFCIKHCSIKIFTYLSFINFSMSEGGFHCRELNEWLALSQIKKRG